MSDFSVSALTSVAARGASIDASGTGGAVAPTAMQAARFESALARAAQSSEASSLEVYVKQSSSSMTTGPGDVSLSKVGDYGRAMSSGFKASIDDAFAKLNHLDLTNPASMVTMMEVQLGVMAAGVQVGFATQVADKSVHSVTTLFRNQG